MKEELNEYCLEVARVIVIIIGFAMLLYGVITVHDGLGSGDSNYLKAKALSIVLAQPTTSTTTYTLEARNRAVDDEWWKDVILANKGDTIEVRLRLFSTQAEDVSREAVYDSGLPYALANGLKQAESGTRKSVVLPDGTTSDYLENAFDENVQYYYIGTFRLDDLPDDGAIPTIKVWKDGGYNASLYIAPPYDCAKLLSGIMFIVIASILGVIIAIVMGKLSTRKLLTQTK